MSCSELVSTWRSIVQSPPLQLGRGAQKLMGENLKLVWAEFSTISQAVLPMCMYLSMLMARPHL